MTLSGHHTMLGGVALPFDNEVEYLESTGTQYIRSGISATSTTRIKVLVSFATTVNGFAFGAYANPTYIGAQYYSGIGLRVFCGRASANYNQSGFVAGTPYLYEIDNATGAISVDGTVVKTTGTAGGVGGTINLFGNVGTDASSASASCRIYSVQIWDGQTLVRDFIPVRKGTTGELYDRVSGKFAERHGDFLFGADVVPVEYIQQTGTQYIDTLYSMANTRREVITVDWSGHSTTYREVMAGAASGSYLVELSPSGYYGTAYNDYSSIHVSTKDKIRWDYTVGIKPYLYINDVFAIQDSLLRVPTGNIQTGGVGTPGVNYPKMKIYSLDVYTDDSVQVRKMRPVRVGTEGAMMDVLTRRFYRREGSGAFAIGSDVSAARGGGCKRLCVRRSSRSSARFWCTSYGWEVAA